MAGSNNDTNVAKLGSSAGRSLIDFTPGPRGPGDPRNRRQSQQAGAAQLPGAGLGLDAQGRMIFDPEAFSLHKAAAAASESGANAAVEAVIAGAEPSAWAGVTRRFWTSRTAESFSDTLDPQTFMEETVPAGLLEGDRTLHTRLNGSFLNGNANGADMTIRIAITLGGVAVWDETSGTFALDNSGEHRRPMIIDFEMWRPAANSANVRCMGTVAVAGVRGATTTGLGDMDAFPTLTTNASRASFVYPFGSVAAGVAVDMDAEQDLKVAVTMSAKDTANFTTYNLRYMEIT